ncbi:MAG: NAD(P)/FAD-dependent oxidoreductase, partial [Dictyoglomi bacterium]|nr:NAD(P)/FAD-dependent oxidoreductase [Dictyoglomota bacterium]
MSEVYDVVVIGAGISGSTIFYLLNKYQIKTLLVEKSADIAGGGATKANSAIIHSGHDPKPGTLKAKLNVRGNYLWHKWVEKLNIPFYPTGAMIVATEEDRQETIYELKERAKKNGVEAYIISGEEARKREPHLTEKTTMALVTPTAGIIHPMRAAIAPVANGIKNGGELKLLTEVTNITRDEETGLLNVHTNRGIFKTRIVINAAGLFADKIMAMVGEDWFKITPRRGEYLIIDDDAPLHVSTVLFPTPTPISKGILVLPTVGMEVMIGPNAENLDKPDTATTLHGLQTVIKGAKKLVPFEYEKWAFASFAGLRPTG